MLAIARTSSTARAVVPLFCSISTSALDPAVGAGGGASDWRKKARVAAKIGVYLNLNASRCDSGVQVGNQVHSPITRDREGSKLRMRVVCCARNPVFSSLKSLPGTRRDGNLENSGE
jgi:hypothetical protein